MPAIKLKKAAAEHQAEKEREEREREAEAPTSMPPKPAKDKETQPGASLLRGLDANILFEKRKRQIAPSEQKVMDWIEANLETKEDSHVNLHSLYDYFGEACSFDGTPVVAMEIFQKRIVDKFGKCYALKESSPYKGIIKERTGKGKSAPVKAETLKIKMKDIIEEALKEAGNPPKGIRFHALKQYIACNYPALRVDLRPTTLKVALDKGIRFGQIELVKGIGLAGFYRLPVDEEPDESEEKSMKEESKSADEKETDIEHQNGDAAEDGEKEKPEEEVASTSNEKGKEKKKSRKRKAVESNEKGEEGETEADNNESEGESKKKKKKRKKKKLPKRVFKYDSCHSAPQRIEDTFALAMTYMCEPKQASFGKIKKYIFEHYPQVTAEEKLKQHMIRGEKKGYWENLTGKGSNGTFRLLIDEFDPNSTDNIEDMICSAIIACNEPKQASSNLLKKYVLEYHPEFNVESKPFLFNRALERALKKRMILQLSGIGASGSFQMWNPFSPSPALLAGDEDTEEIEQIFNEKAEKYVPRGTKSRKLVKKPQEEFTPAPQKKKPGNKKRKSGQSTSKPAKSSSRSRKKVAYSEKDSDDDEEDDEETELSEDEVEEEEEEPIPKKARKTVKGSKANQKKVNAKSTQVKKGKKPLSRSQLNIKKVEEEGDEKEKSKQSKKSNPVEEEEETSAKSSRGRGKARPNYVDDKGDSDDESTAKKGRKSSSSRRSSKPVSYGEEDEVEEEEKQEYTPRKSKSRGGAEEQDSSPSPKKSKKRR